MNPSIFRRFLNNVGGLTVNPVSRDLQLRGQPFESQFLGWKDIRGYAGGADRTGVIDCNDSIVAAIADAPRAAAYNDPRTPEGAVIYFPYGKYRNDVATIDLASGETDNHYSQGITLQGDTTGSTILYTNSLTTLFSGNTATEKFKIKDMTIISYATYTGLGTIENLVDLLECTYVQLENVRIYIRYPGAGNTDARCLSLIRCYYSGTKNCHTYTHSIATTERHNVSFAANATRYGGTQIYTEDNNALYIRDHRFENPYRAMHLVNEDGAMISGGDVEQYVQGFKFDNCEFCNVNIRFETHAENIYQYDGDGIQYAAQFDETSEYNEVEGAAWISQTNLSDFGYIDKNGSNVFKLRQMLGRTRNRTLIRNGNFAQGGYTDGSTFKIPGWTVVGAGTTVTNETTDLPPEHGITRVMKIVSTANVNGIKTVTFTLDPEKLPKLSWRFLMKRVSGDHSLRLLLNSASAGYLVSNFLTQSRGSTPLTTGVTGIPISGTPVWAANILTINTAVPNCFVKVNQKITLAGFTSTTSINASFLVTEVTDDDTFKLAVNYDPGPITVVGTFARTGIDDAADLSEWREYKGIAKLRRSIVGIRTVGGNIELTLNGASWTPNTGSTVKIWGTNNSAYNTTHAVVSSTGATGAIVTITDPGGALPTHNGHGDAALTGIDWFGYCGFYGDVNVAFGAEFTTAVNTTATHLVGGVVLTTVNGEPVIGADYLPATDTFIGAKTFDWPNCVAGTEQSTTVPVPGAVIGDSVTFGMTIDNASLQKSAVILTNGIATCTIRNPTGADINLAASNLITVTAVHTY